MTTDESKLEGKGRKKTVILIVGLLLGEAVALAVVFMMFATEPQVARAGIEDLTPAELELERIQEIEVVNDKMPNAKRGVTYLYDARIFVQVKQRNAARMNRELEQFGNEIKAEIVGIFRTSDPRVFTEPRLETLQRRLEMMFHERMGTSDGGEEPIVEKVVIVLGPGYRVAN